MDDATLQQVRASDPLVSTWLSANAGSGKTRVLTDRVARLLLSGVEPQRILCLTYTKAAASEMQNRLFSRLGSWAMLPDDTLRGALETLGEDLPRDPDLLARARRLFARAIETPGGLKIQTIHSFCSSVLRRFPLEAGVPPDFREAEERSLAALKGEVLNEIAQGPMSDTLHRIARHLDEGRLMKLIAELGKFSDDFRPDALASLQAGLGLSPGETRASILQAAFAPGDIAAVQAMVPLIAQGSPTDAKRAALLGALDWSDDQQVFKALKKWLLTEEDEIRKTPLNKDALNLLRGHGFDTDALLPSLADDVLRARDRLNALDSLQAARDLHDFALAWIPAFAQAKARRGWLDFDDLILRAGALLRDPAVAQWVLFKLDGGIDHILIDEAQDTSPAQWKVVELLTEAFAEGSGPRGTPRTVFVVGDKKQSIYSFQGADLRGFDRMRDVFARRMAHTGQTLNQMELRHSFRSSAAILRVVDACFGNISDGLGGEVSHLAFHETMPGRVDLWPVIPKTDRVDPGEWDDPLDRPSDENHEAVLARAVAAEIRHVLDSGAVIQGKSGARPVHAGDFLILVRRRKLLFAELIRACKAQGLQIAGADRLRLGEELAVRDLLALLRVLALPEDDLSLAAVLRSPLFGWSEDRLYRLAQGRGPVSLWQRLRENADADTLPVFQDLMGQVDFLRPFDLLQRVLLRHDGRRRLVSRLGPEAEDPIDALVSMALVYERDEVPTLDGFLCWVDGDDAEIKRQPDSAGHRIRVMTVHGAKGLEAPIVILPDTDARRPPPDSPVVATVAAPALLGAKPNRPALIQDAVDDNERRAQEESDRLLYVAMTRAESWLIVAAAGDTGRGTCWYDRVAGVMDQLSTTPLPTPAGVGVRFSHGDWPDRVTRPVQDAPAPAPLVLWPPRRVDPGLVLRAPSDLGGAKTLPGPGDETEAALLRGRAVHLLLEHLPGVSVTDRARRARDILGDMPEFDALLAEASAVLDAPGLARFLAPDTLSEVPLVGAWNGQVLHGVIDRLLVTDGHVLALDFKTNRQVPRDPAQVPEGLLRQMGAYAHLLAALYPRHRIETALLWTAQPGLMILPDADVAAALARAALDPLNRAP
jgi:ATP-dependent helicase/nuclease subunit A